MVNKRARSKELGGDVHSAEPPLAAGQPVSGWIKRDSRYSSWGSRSLGEFKWFIAGCAWSVYTIAFIVLGVQNMGANVSVGLVAWLAASLAGIYAFRIWTRRSKWIFVVIPLIF
jgi:hypothetical protein